MAVKYMEGNEASFGGVTDLRKKANAVSEHYKHVRVIKIMTEPMIVACNGDCYEDKKIEDKSCVKTCADLVWFDPNIYSAKDIADLVESSLEPVA